MRATSPITCRPRLLVVEDELEQFETYCRALPHCGLTRVPTVTAALAALRDDPPDLVILDHILADGERGADRLAEIRRAAAHLPVIIISGALDLDAQLRALEGGFGAHFVLEKPVTLDRLEETVARALDECGIGQIVAGLKAIERREKENWSEPDRRFTERLERQHALLAILRELPAGQRLNLTTLGERFGVDRRSIRRDLEDLEKRGHLRRGDFEEEAGE